MSQAEILLIEDNQIDVRMALEALQEASLVNRIHVVRDGEEALDFVYRRGDFGMAPRPDLILLDLSLPKVDGREVLERLKQDPELSGIPVVIMTASNAETDMVRSFQLNVACYIVKPVDLTQLASIIPTISGLSLDVVTDKTAIMVSELAT